MWSGFKGVATGLVAGIKGTTGGVVGTDDANFSTVSEAQDWGLLALVEPGEEAVASDPFSPEVAFSAFLHLARLF